MPRIVVLHHVLPENSSRANHFDLMLEHDGVLLTWKLSNPPVDGEPQNATRLPDHRLHYLDYEGPISDDRGSVTRWDVGMHSIEIFADGRIVTAVIGNKLRGRLTLEENTPEKSGWTAHFEGTSE